MMNDSQIEQLTLGESRKQVEHLSGITAQEIEKLHRTRIYTLGELWWRAGGDPVHWPVGGKPDEAIDFTRVERQSGISADRLMEFLPERLLQIAIRQAQHNIRQFDGGMVTKSARGFKRHFFDILLIIGLGLIILLLFRAFKGGDGLFGNVAGLNAHIIVASENIKSGRPLRRGDVFEAKLGSCDKCIQRGLNVEGLYATRDIARNMPLRFDDVSRQQLIAAVDIRPGTIIDEKAVALEWSAYDPEAVTAPDQAVNRTSQQAIRKGTVIIHSFLNSSTVR
ncbi:MAG TPA: SAF domain-containing protein [Pyrinomonadaceae bacterium]